MKKETNKKITIDDLALMMLKGFEEVKTDLRSEMSVGFKKIDVRFDQIGKRFEDIEEELVKIRGNVNNTRDNFVPYHKFDALVTRVTNIENKGKSKTRK